MPTTKEKVKAYLLAHPQQAFCDFCLMVAVHARERQIAQRATTQLAHRDSVNFRRRKALCSNAGQPDHLTRAKLCITFVGAAEGPRSN